jgi:hypothetical protein
LRSASRNNAVAVGASLAALAANVIANRMIFLFNDLGGCHG